MPTPVTVRIDDDLERELDRMCKSAGLTRSEVVREALRRQLRRMEFASLRRELMPYAEAQGWLTDEDVFREVS